MAFTLHDRLAADTEELVRWPLCRVLMMRDAAYPWLILVPEREGLRELHDLSEDEGIRLFQEVSKASRALQAAISPDKLNVAALGNLVPQLHIHVVARFEGDPAWPGPVWGAAAPIPFGPGEQEARVALLTTALIEAG